MTIYQHSCAETPEDKTYDLLAWTTEHSEHFQTFADGGESTLKGVRPFHPVYVIPQSAIHLMQDWSRSHAGINHSLSGKT